MFSENIEMKGVYIQQLTKMWDKDKYNQHSDRWRHTAYGETLWAKVSSESVLVMGGSLLPPHISVCSLPVEPLVAGVCLQVSGSGPRHLHTDLTGSLTTAGPLNYAACRVRLFWEFFKGLWWGNSSWKQPFSRKNGNVCMSLGFCIFPHMQLVFPIPNLVIEWNQMLTAAWQTYRIVAAIYVSAWISEIPKRDRCCLQPGSEAEQAVCPRHTLWSPSPRRGRRQRACQYSSSRMLW